MEEKGANASRVHPLHIFRDLDLLSLSLRLWRICHVSICHVSIHVTIGLDVDRCGSHLHHLLNGLRCHLHRPHCHVSGLGC